MRITDNKKNELLLIFKENGLEKSNFDILEEPPHFFRVKYKLNYFSFQIEKQSELQYSITILSINNTEEILKSGGWKTVLKEFKRWSLDLSQEITIGKVWESYDSFEFISNDYDSLNENFSETEKIEVNKSLTRLKEQIKCLENISIEKMSILENKIDNLSIKTEDLSKFDWKSLFIGTIMNLIVTLNIPTEATGMLWVLIKNAFSNFNLKA